MAITLDAFVKKYIGKAVDIDKNYGPQCWDLAEAYAHQVLNIPQNPWALDTGNGTAYGAWLLYSSNGNARYYSKKSVWTISHVHLPSTRRTPPKGALVFFDYQLPGSGGAGHVGVVLSGNRSSFVSFDQNWAGPYSTRVTHNFDHVAGYLVKK